MYLILSDSKITLGLATLWIHFFFLWTVEAGVGEMKYVVRRAPSLAGSVSCPSQVECTQVLPSK